MIIKNALIQKNFALKKADLKISGGKIAEIGEFPPEKGDIDAEGLLVIPGVVDVHAHLREPGFSHKETVRTGTLSAAKGGITSVMAMPNTDPVIDSLENLDFLEKIIARDAAVKVYSYASLTKGEKGIEPTDIRALSKRVLAFSDDGTGFNNIALLKEAMKTVKECGSMICSHAEAKGYTAEDSEYAAVDRELELVKEIGCKYHFCHMSDKRSFGLIKRAKAEGLDVTCEVTPHHLFLSEKDIINTNFKMNPPLRKESDSEAAVEALLTGIADMAATDHAPHTEAEKSLPYGEAPNGIIGFETLLPLLYTKLIRTGKAKVEDLIKWTSANPAKRFGIPNAEIQRGSRADLAVIDVTNAREYLKSEILSKGKNSPFIGARLYGFNRLTVLGGKAIYNDTSEVLR
jgi:dihydroorotase, multifunctional complex type